MDKIFKDTILLIAGHAIILGHKPDNLKASDINKLIEEHPQDIEQFGLFDSASPNYTTYYPDVTAEDLNPIDSEFINPIFRMLSNVTVHAKFNPIYFPVAVLKSGMKLLIGQTINIDHEWAVGNAIGSIASVEWQDAYKDGAITVPAGINAVMKIDGKSNPRIARGIMMDPPSIHSNSVTVTFEWVKSHPEISDEEFWSKIGSYDKKGNLIQRVVSKILVFHETSLVGHGADPFAQRVKDGKIVNPKYAKARYPLHADLKEEAENYAVWDWKHYSGKDIISNNTTILEEFNNEVNNKQNLENMEFLKLVESIFGFEADSLTKENCEAKLKEIKTQFDQFKVSSEKTPEIPKIGEFEGIEAITSEITRLQGIEKELPEDLSIQLALAKDGKILIDQLRAETERLYKLTIKDEKTADANLLAVIAGADYKTLESLHKQYDGLAEDEFELTCNKCQSHDITRASAQAGEEGEGGTESVIKSNEEVINKFTTPQPAKMTIFEQDGKK